MLSAISNVLHRFFIALQHQVKRQLKPNTQALVIGATTDLTRSKANLIAENALLRQQLIILQRQSKRPQLNNFDRIKLILLARSTPFWKQALLIVQPDTLLRAGIVNSFASSDDVNPNQNWQNQGSRPRR